MSREAMQMALEALVQLDGIDTETECVTIDVDDVITALRQALETEQEPVAWISESENLLSWDKFYDHMKPLYTAPPRQWVGLTDEDEIPWDGVDAKSFARAIEQALKEKNHG